MAQNNTASPNDYKRHLHTLISGPPHLRHQAIKALVADAPNRKIILEHIAEMITEQSAIVYGPTPDGLKPGEPEKYVQLMTATTIEQAAIQTALGILGPDALLDDDSFVGLIDNSGMLERLERWPDHISTMKQRALEAATLFKSKHKEGSRDIGYVRIFGLGGSAAPHDIVADVIGNFKKSSIRIEVIHADTPNPDYIDENTLAIFSSFSGNTEETIHCYKTVRDKTDLLLVLTKGGELRRIADQDKIPVIQLPDGKKHRAYVLQPRESVCLQMTAVLTFLACLGLKPGSEGAFNLADLTLDEEAIPLLKKWRQRFDPLIPFKSNPAKQLAFFLLYGIGYNADTALGGYDLWQKRVPCVLVDRNNWGIGHEVRKQLHERSKVNAVCYEAPEFLHNLVESVRAAAESSHAGLDQDPFVYYLIRSLDEQPRIRLRLDKTIGLVIQEKGHYAVLNAEGENPFQRALFVVYFNAHTTTYCGILNGYDPLPVPTMDWIKNIMREIPRNGEEEKKAQIAKRALVAFNSLGI